MKPTEPKPEPRQLSFFDVFLAVFLGTFSAMLLAGVLMFIRVYLNMRSLGG